MYKWLMASHLSKSPTIGGTGTLGNFKAFACSVLHGVYETFRYMLLSLLADYVAECSSTSYQ
jgi:hypothetical protein